MAIIVWTFWSSLGIMPSLGVHAMVLDLLVKFGPLGQVWALCHSLGPFGQVWAFAP